MRNRLEAIGIKQVVRLEWYELALNLMLGGRSEREIRKFLDEFISERKQSGGYGERGEQTYTKAITQIMKSWVAPEEQLIPFRNDLLKHAGSNSLEIRTALHWAVTCAAYPFWFRLAFQTGRLLNLQNAITQNQIRLRCFEAMGERSTVERSARRVIRMFVQWGILEDSNIKGCYKRSIPIKIADPNLAILLFESALIATPGATSTMRVLLNNPAFFPFQLPAITGDFISQHSERIEVARFSLDEEFLKLKENRN